MRIVSLLPSATEIVFALGLATSLSAHPRVRLPARGLGKPVVTRTSHDLGDASVARDQSLASRRRSTAARRSTSSTRTRSPPPTPDLILTQELCEVCAVSYREVNEVARAIDADITVVTLEPTSHRGHPQHDLDGRRDGRGRGRGGRPRRDPPRAAGAHRERASSSAARRRPRRAASSASSGSTRRSPSGHWVPEQVRRAGGWDLLGRRASRRVETTWDAVRDVDPEMLMLMPCGFDARRDGRRVVADAASRPGSAELGAVRTGEVFALDGSAYFCRPGSAGRRRRRAARRALRSRTRSSTIAAARRRGRRSPAERRPSVVPFQASFNCLWCGPAHTTRAADDLEGWAQLCPDCVGKAGDNEFLRFRLRQA